MGDRFSKIIPQGDEPDAGLYLGSIDYLVQDSVLDELNIKAIVCVLPAEPEELRPVMSRHQIPPSDWLVYCLEDIPEQYCGLYEAPFTGGVGIHGVIDFIHRKRKENKTVLLHCDAGLTRSPTVAMSYLMKYGEHLNDIKPLRLDQAKDIVMKRRGNKVDVRLFEHELELLDKQMFERDPSLRFEDNLITSRPLSDSWFTLLLSPKSTQKRCRLSLKIDAPIKDMNTDVLSPGLLAVKEKSLADAIDRIPSFDFTKAISFVGRPYDILPTFHTSYSFTEENWAPLQSSMSDFNEKETRAIIKRTWQLAIEHSNLESMSDEYSRQLKVKQRIWFVNPLGLMSMISELLEDGESTDCCFDQTKGSYRFRKLSHKYRHMASYDEDCDNIKTAFLNMMEKHLPSGEWTPSAQQAWRKGITMLFVRMKFASKHRTPSYHTPSLRKCKSF